MTAAGGGQGEAREQATERSTDSGIEIRRSYDAGDLAGWDPAERLGQPGRFPYTRGVQADMYRGRLWTMRQYAGFGIGRLATNERFKFLLAEAGQTGLFLRLRPPDPDGLRLDHPRRRRRRGREGRRGDRLGRGHEAVPSSRAFRLRSRCGRRR